MEAALQDFSHASDLAGAQGNGRLLADALRDRGMAKYEMGDVQGAIEDATAALQVRCHSRRSTAHHS